ncbi:hypothetical protein QQM39_06565 [Streptomyces sp. DT2A-34]|uniref:hypothetical protein n=1 Tax=Streptomyces sp. DT2A-34 TaxID=3051182 RepID=UPI00265BE1F0|nr:hypothetical protein [Streptomyces sp. DT2A-34]MDO0910530.1 hypothetical protein [Streptomyces sp. DT2A-34]
MALFLLLVNVAIVLGIIGVGAKGLFYFLVIGVVILVADFVLLGLHLGRPPQEPAPETRSPGAKLPASPARP